MEAKENMLRVIRHDHPAWVPNGMESVETLMPPVVERPASAGSDAFGVPWSFNAEAEGGTFPTHGDVLIPDLERWQHDLFLPDLDALDWSAVERQASAIDREKCLVQGFVEMGLFERSYLLMGLQEALIAYVTDPERMSGLLGAIAEYKIELITRFDRAAHLDLVWFGDDWGTQSQLFLPPATWRVVIKPHLQRIYACMQRLGILINQHSCGRIEPIFGDMVDMGVDLWNPCQPCNDLAGMKRRYGSRIAFCGGIDSQFVLGRPGVTASEVRTEVRRRIDELAAGDGYIAAPSHTVPYDPRLLAAMNDEIDTYGREFYRAR